MKKACIYAYSYGQATRKGSHVYIDGYLRTLRELEVHTTIVARAHAARHLGRASPPKRDTTIRTVNALRIEFGPTPDLLDKMLTFSFTSKNHLYRECSRSSFLHTFSHTLTVPHIPLLRQKYDIPIITSIIEDVWNPISRHPSHLAAHLYHRIQLEAALRYSDIITVQSRRDAHLVHTAFPERSSKIHYLPMPIEPRRWRLGDRQNRASRLPRGVVILVPQRATWTKGVDLALRAMSPIVEEDPDIEMVVVGGGPLVLKLMELAKALSIGDHVKFVPEADEPALKKQYSLADIVVVPSRSEGGQPPYSVVEPMLMSKPVLMSNACDTYHTLEDGVSRFKTGDYSDLCGKLRAMIEDGELRRSLAANSRKAIMELHSPELFRRRSKELYQRFLS
ncbi:MAG: glycosyltransferase family 4 protein [Thermoplasmata archaeon]